MSFEIIDQNWIKSNINLFLKKRVVIITGAGISVSSGIPDFRSTNGIFSEIRKTLKIKGEDLFNYRYSRDDTTRPNYYKFIARLKELVETVEPSVTHEFLNTFKTYQKKYRVYTQNIDSLEEKAGMKHEDKKNTELVYLHGDMKVLICIFCGFKIKFTEAETTKFKLGEDISCTKCIEMNLKRKENKTRQLKKGYLHTNIIHYNQPHYDGHRIANLFESDMDLDLFIVMGTSLKVYGVKDFVKRALRCCINNNGTSILVNLEDPTKEFQKMFDYFWKDKSDDFCKAVTKNINEHIEKRRTSISTIKNADNIISYTNKTLSVILEKSESFSITKTIEVSEDCSISIKEEKKTKCSIKDTTIVKTEKPTDKKNKGKEGQVDKKLSLYDYVNVKSEIIKK